jgi:predicted TIM-barrel fold metal-dependent hydrolase
LTNLHYNCARNLYPLLAKFENLYVETIGFKVYGGIEDVCEKFGAGRLLFGTGAPKYAGSGAVGMITYAGISDAEKRMIASGNLERILESILYD